MKYGDEKWWEELAALEEQAGGAFACSPTRYVAIPVLIGPPLLTELPLGLAGKIFGSAMPFGFYDPHGQLFQELKRAAVSTVVLLADIDECREKAGQDLVALYQQEGLAVLSLPIPNYGLSPIKALAETLSEVVVRAKQGQNILIHCSAGRGRTALFAALLAKKVLGLSGLEAIQWLGQHKPDALLTPAQTLLIMEGER